MASVPLPPTPENLQGSALDAYSRLLPLQSQHPVKIRLLGWMLIHAPSVAGQHYVATCINQCEDDAEVISWGDWFIQYFAAYFKTSLHEPTPTPSTHPSRPDLDALQAGILASLDEAPRDYRDAKKRALVRDNYRCVLSGTVDIKTFKASTQLQNAPGINNVAHTECSHILPKYLNQGLGNPYRREAAASVWTVLRCFGDVEPVELNGLAMHNLCNILTLKSDYHKSFDSLQIWLDPIDGTEHQYMIGKASPFYHTELPATVTFTTTNPKLPLPDRRYLALHAACAKVVNMSGAARLIDKILDDAAETKVLSGDGSSGELLTRLLSIEALTVH